MNLQFMEGPAGQLLWVSGALPGSVHDKKAAWTWGAEDELAAAGLSALAGKGYQGAAHAKTLYKGEEQARAAERGQPGPRETPGTRRKGERPAQCVEDPHPATLLPLARRPDRQSHPRFAGSRASSRMKRVHGNTVFRGT
jgi:hypothetical protein